LLVEAGLQSGALITANLAADFGRQVFAIPGPIDRPSSAGANRLIQDGAKLVMDAADVLDEMSVLIPSGSGQPRERNPTEESPPAPPAQAALLRLLAHGEMDPDTLVRQSGMSAPEVTSNLLALELNRKVTRTAGNWYRLGGSP
jgi:DNA processing protein